MKLLSSDPEEIPKIIQGHQIEARAIIDQIIELCWYMRGGLSREEAWHLSVEERNRMVKFIDKNIERVNKSGLPIL